MVFCVKCDCSETAGSGGYPCWFAMIVSCCAYHYHSPFFFQIKKPASSVNYVHYIV